ncbi:unnamed protein product [Ophioblennius macclurei]
MDKGYPPQGHPPQGYPPQENAPPYPGPPMNYGGPTPQPGQYPQQGFPPPSVPPPGVYQGVSYAPPPGAPLTTVTHVVAAPQLLDTPARVVCPHCQQSVVTNTNHTAGLLAWAICGGLTLFGCFLCCFIPFCIDSCQDVEHRCPSCHQLISIYKRM